MNTVGIIDADYWEGKNEGHIMIKLYNPMNLHSDPTGNLQVKRWGGNRTRYYYRILYL